ncbi:MAG: hypothetical protein ACK476_14705 [Fluviicola sp.]|jgi:hypothetical protein
MYWFVVLTLVYIGICYLIAVKIGTQKRIGFLISFIICLTISPFFGLFIVENSPLKNPRGCKWCGNKLNEVEFCGICMRNEKGDFKQ